MTLWTSLGHPEDPLDPDDPDERSPLNHEQSTFLASDQIHSPLSEEQEDKEHARQVSSWNTLPWWKKPSPYWVIFGVPFSSIAYSALLAPKVAMYTALACRVHRPEFITNSHSLVSPHSFASPQTHNLTAINSADVPMLNTSDGGAAAAYVLLPPPAYTTLSDYSKNGPASEHKCASDPVVQAVVAKLNAVFITAMGILSCLTTGWWGSLSDRYGRRIVVLVSVFGLFVNDVTHVITARFVDVLPGGYWFPLLGYLIEGICGSLSTGSAIYQAYLADTTDPSTRSRYFPLSLGFMFTGVAVGPVLGGLLIRSTGTILSVIYFASILHGIYIVLILFILPESLTRARALSACLQWRQEKPNKASSDCALGALKSVTRFLSPLVVLLPEQSWDADQLKRRSKDWSLFCIAIAYGLFTSALGSSSYKFQYAAAQFNWTSEITSYYVAFTGAIRVIFFAVILPLVLTHYQNPFPVQSPCMSDETLQGVIGPPPTHDVNSPPSSTRTDAPEQYLPVPRSPAADLALARASAGLGIISYASMAVASTGALFALASTIGSFGVGLFPATQALALEIYINRRPHNRNEVGRLFGALSVVQALGYVFLFTLQAGFKLVRRCWLTTLFTHVVVWSFVSLACDRSQIISPALYGFVYFNTVAIFPQTIMLVSMCISLLALTLLLFVRIPSELASDYDTPGCGDEEEGSQAADTPDILVAIGVQVEGR